MEFKYQILNDRLDKMGLVIQDLQERDDNIYRVIFEAEPIPTSIRKAGFGGVDRYADLDGYLYSGLLKSTSEKLDIMAGQLVVQSKSFDEVFEMAKQSSVSCIYTCYSTC